MSVYNRIGDLFLKVKDPAQAADYYDRSVDRYAELGFHNNAIAMCNKVLRNAPGRPNTYLKLAKLYAAKGFLGEAKQNFVEFAERMKKAGSLDVAFAALKQVTDLSPETENLKHMLEQHLQTYGDVQRRPSRTSTAAPALPPEPKSGKRKTSSLVFLDLDEPSGKGKAAASAPAAPAAPTAPAAPPKRQTPPPQPAPRPTPRPQAAPQPPAAKAPPAAPAARQAPPVEDEAATDDGGLLEGFETTSFDFGAVRKSAKDIPQVRDPDPRPSGGKLKGLEPTRAPEADEESAELLDYEPEIEVPPPPPPPPPAAKGAPPPAPPPPRKTVVEVPPLELEPDFEETTARGHDVDESPLAADEGEVAQWIETEDDGKKDPMAGQSSGFIDLGLDGVINADAQAGTLIFSGLEEPGAAAPSIEDLEARVADNPDDADAHRSLGEALIEAGERDRGIEELDHASAGYETAGNVAQAQDLVEEILRLDPNSVRHRQKNVEYAFRANDKTRLIDAYLELADTLLRANLPEKARAVYERVAEHDPGNARATAALNMLAPAPAPAAEGRVSPKDAKMRVRDAAAEDTGDFVDLGALVLAEDSERDSRMRVEDEAPTGDEEKDFQDMLSRFRQGIDENIDEGDFQSHYDLGIAFKEMGLLDEAIAEFQKALRAPEGKLRTSEALGQCFVEKGALSVAESILRRGLELPANDDKERLGVLYWLGRALEGQSKNADAKTFYDRVCAVDIRFMDVGNRVRAMARA